QRRLASRRAAAEARLRPREDPEDRPRAAPREARLLDRRLRAPPPPVHPHGAPGALRGDPRAAARQAQLPEEDPLARPAQVRRPEARRRRPPPRAALLVRARQDEDPGRADRMKVLIVYKKSFLESHGSDPKGISQ